MNPIFRQKFRAALLRWFDAYRRELPWRTQPDPYRVWTSEIMLQQTRVAAVLEHYQRFLKRFPDLRSLARARPASVLAAWSGLGYYRRARLMQAAARQLLREQGGHFPRSSAQWRELPGVGRYTAAAIASICYGECCAVVDGNVKRVLARLQGSAGDPWIAANQLLSRGRPGDFNQAMMELGATVCTPRAPACAACPARKWCRAAQDTAQSTAALTQRRRRGELAYALVVEDNHVLLVRRSDGQRLMPGMWELPAVPSAAAHQQKTSPEFTVRHAIMDTDYLVSVVREPADEWHAARGMAGKWWPVKRAGGLPLTGLARKILKRAGMI